LALRLRLLHGQRLVDRRHAQPRAGAGMVQGLLSPGEPTSASVPSIIGAVTTLTSTNAAPRSTNMPCTVVTSAGANPTSNNACPHHTTHTPVKVTGTLTFYRA
jgi:hypothetical protein